MHTRLFKCPAEIERLSLCNLAFLGFFEKDMTLGDWIIPHLRYQRRTSCDSNLSCKPGRRGGKKLDDRVLRFLFSHGNLERAMHKLGARGRQAQ